MEEERKPKKSFRVSALYKRKTKTASAQISSTQSSLRSSMQAVESIDTQKTRNRYNNAVQFLQDAIEALGGNQWHGLQLEGEMEDFDDSQLRKRIDDAIKIQNISIKDQGAWEKCMYAMQCIFTVLSPFARSFLTIMMQGSAVIHLLLFH